MVQGFDLTSASLTSRRATSSARRIVMALRSCSAATWKSSSPILRASRKKMLRPSVNGIARPKKSPRRFSCPSATPSLLPKAEREALLSQTALGREFLEVSNRQPLDVVRELFENEHVRLLFLFKVSLFGTWLVDTMSKTARWAR